MQISRDVGAVLTGLKFQIFFGIWKNFPEFRSSAVHFQIHLWNRLFQIFSLFSNSRGGFGTGMEPTHSTCNCFKSFSGFLRASPASTINEG